MSKFSLANATPGKRAAEETSDGTPKKFKIPKAPLMYLRGVGAEREGPGSGVDD